MTLPRLVETWPQTVEILRDVAATEGAVFVDGYEAVPGDLQHLRDHVHLTDAGAERLAQAVAAGLVADARFRALVARVRAAPERP